jgi:cytochrome c peroxidase
MTFWQAFAFRGCSGTARQIPPGGELAAARSAAKPPYMHDGSLVTLRDVILFYKRGGVRNPHLDTRIRPLDLSRSDIDALVDFLGALDGEGFMDRAPTAFPK